MNVTPNLIKGELYLIEKQLHLPFVRFYHKSFYDDKFIRVMIRSLERKYKDLKVEYDSNDYEYIIKIKERKKDE